MEYQTKTASASSPRMMQPWMIVRRASEVVQSAPGYQTRFHWQRSMADEPAAEVSAAAERRRSSRR